MASGLVFSGIERLFLLLLFVPLPDNVWEIYVETNARIYDLKPMSPWVFEHTWCVELDGVCPLIYAVPGTRACMIIVMFLVLV